MFKRFYAVKGSFELNLPQFWVALWLGRLGWALRIFSHASNMFLMMGQHVPVVCPPLFLQFYDYVGLLTSAHPGSKYAHYFGL